MNLNKPVKNISKEKHYINKILAKVGIFQKKISSFHCCYLKKSLPSLGSKT